MRRAQPLGMDELMIVNPGPPGARRLGLLVGYRACCRQGAGAPGPYFMGDDGALYRVQGLGEAGGHEPCRLFLGEDGTLYRVVR